MLDKQKTLWLCFIIIKNKQQIYRYTNADSQKNHLSWYSCWWLFWLYERYTQSMLHPFSKQRQCVLHYLFTSLVVSPNYVHNVDPMILFKFLFTWSVLVPNQNMFYWYISELPIKEYSFSKLRKQDSKAVVI